MRHPSRVVLVLLVVILLPCLAPAVGDEEQPSPEALAPARWLVLPAVDEGARVPFSPSRTFERHLLKADAKPPTEGEVLTGVSGREGTWQPALPDAKGDVDPGEGAIAYGTLEAPEDGVWLAEVLRAAVLYVNGAPHVGDVYGHGITRAPVFLHEGTNHLFAAGFRGKFRIRLERPPKPVFLATWDATLPDLVDGGSVWSKGKRVAGVIVVNASDVPARGLRPRSRVIRGERAWKAPPIWEVLPTIPPGGMMKIAVRLPDDSFPVEGEEARLEVTLEQADGAVLDEAAWPLEVRHADGVHRRTFLSFIDDSAQFYGVRPAVGPLPEGGRMHLVLSLHGAGVDAFGQARSYSARPDFQVVAATNRRPFGFDWQDWGREDAYEVLADALATTGVDRRDVHVTGHSMGGHGTWHLAVNDPDGFASAAPSAGWISFDTYAGGRPETLLGRFWRAADRAGDTLALVSNLRRMPLYVLHGDADDNVPPSEARTMQRVLEDVAEDATFHYQEGAGHWWNGDAAPGTDCVDWPPIFDLFRRTRIPENPDEIDVIFPDLTQDHVHHWIRVEQPLLYGEPCRVRAHRAPPDTVVIETENVRRLVLVRPAIWGRPMARIDDQVFDPPEEGAAPEAFVRREGVWVHAPVTCPQEQKRPERMGPFKRAFDRGFVLVYGTRGDEAEDRALLERARYDAEQWLYRANGCAVCVSDEDFLASPSPPDANVILYGNADTNGAWAALVPETCPLDVRRGKVRIGVKTWEGDDYGLLFTCPRKGSTNALVAAVAATGAPGLRLTLRPRTFLSGVGIPDFVLFGKEILTRGDEGVRAAGFFDHLWHLAD